ncbi:mediator of RNA polymerase II transcription subunit 15 [Anopheles maculipalpis]|uniref:mediator of RNA polymerase II transcription subunit 15 n=1 Tax=Anopheles maculipalpis TaxID=1496333 RepID=UPI002158F5A5|nr:mediator of RNA polymerase II transcription subunit 15 [Anopheles maculipalpis]
MDFLTIATCLAGVILAQDYQEYRQAPLRIGTKAEEPKPTPVPILKQINRHNEDGSYTYGYEGADGSFKIETKLATGEVKGKYGYVDETGKVKVVEYGANKYGFQPSGEGITVPPPTLVDETTGKDDLLEDDDGNIPAPRLQKHRPISKPRFQEVPIQQHQPQRPQQHQPQQSQPQYYDYDEQPAPLPQPKYQPAPQYVQRSHFGAAPSASVGPAPPRAQIPNAVPVDVVYAPKQLPARPDVEYRNVGPQTFPGAAPAGPEPKIRYSQPQFAPSALPPQHSAKSANPTDSFPQPRPQPAVYQPRPAQGRSTSVLDQLAKDYALPQGGAAPLHDITFGYY